MLKSDLSYSYPEALVATEPQGHFRALFIGADAMPSAPASLNAPVELNAKTQLFDKFTSGDVLVINNTRVERRRIYTANNLEILFLKENLNNEWQVLCPAKQVKDFETLNLPGGVTAQITARGLPQILKVSEKLTVDYFATHGELALPPYIQKARGERHSRPDDNKWYQTAWAHVNGSQAAPTASLHFDLNDIAELKSRGVTVCELTLHVGMGTFLPIKTNNIEEHKMHSEEVFLSQETAKNIIEAKKSGRNIWAMGTTALRALEGWGCGHFQESANGDFSGSTDIFIRPGYKFEVVDRLLTNFHQPESTLLALVMAFAGREKVLTAYDYAIKNNFKLFSYGDLSAWERS